MARKTSTIAATSLVLLLLVNVVCATQPAAPAAPRSEVKIDVGKKDAAAPVTGITVSEEESLDVAARIANKADEVHVDHADEVHVDHADDELVDHAGDELVDHADDELVDHADDVYDDEHADFDLEEQADKLVEHDDMPEDEFEGGDGDFLDADVHAEDAGFEDDMDDNLLEDDEHEYLNDLAAHEQDDENEFIDDDEHDVLADLEADLDAADAAHDAADGIALLDQTPFNATSRAANETDTFPGPQPFSLDHESVVEEADMSDKNEEDIDDTMHEEDGPAMRSIRHGVRHCHSCSRWRKCRHGLICWRGKCVFRHAKKFCFRRECSGCRPRQCNRGLKCWRKKCVKPSRKSRCFRPVTPRRRYYLPNCRFCRYHWQCRSRKCFRAGSRKARCASSRWTYRKCFRFGECHKCWRNSQCLSGKCLHKKCVKQKVVRRHGRLVKITDPFSRKRCFGHIKPPKVGKCGICRSTRNCRSKLVCKPSKWPGKPARCAKRMREGQSCADPCWACGRGLVCNGHTCVRRKKPICSSCRRSSDCQRHLVCKSHGKRRWGVCKKPIHLGRSCSHRCSVCSSGLRCVHGRCVRPKVGKCGTCVSDSSCQHGLLCKRRWPSARTGKCAVPMGEGASCKNPCWTCHKGLQCTGGLCKRPPQGHCGFCKKQGDCLGSLVCKFTAGKGRCAKRMKVGGSCNDVCWACEKHLTCNGGKCVRPKY